MTCSHELFQYDIFNTGITSRLRFATTVMYAYGHEWACQLIYNPQLVPGLGLTDGEGMERLLSRFIKLIGIERSSRVSSNNNTGNHILKNHSGNGKSG